MSISVRRTSYTNIIDEFIRTNPISTMNYHKKSSILDSFGDTKSPEGASRRICMNRFNPKLRIKDLVALFGGYDKVEGVTLFRKNFAIIQFKKLSYFTSALALHDTMFMDYKVCVWVYGDNCPDTRRSINSTKDREVIPRGSSRTHRSRSRSRDRSRNRRRSSSRSRSRDRRRSQSGGRSRSRSPPTPVRSPEYRNRQVVHVSEPATTTAPAPALPQATAITPVGVLINQQEHMTSALFNYNIETRSRINTPGVFGGPRAPSTFQAVGLSTTESNDADLPTNIELILKLTLEAKTARDLAASQIRSVLGYFQAHLAHMEAMSRSQLSCDARVSPDTIIGRPKSPLMNTAQLQQSTAPHSVQGSMTPALQVVPTPTPMSAQPAQTSQSTASPDDRNSSSFVNQPPMRTPQSAGISLMDKLNKIQKSNTYTRQ